MGTGKNYNSLQLLACIIVVLHLHDCCPALAERRWHKNNLAMLCEGAIHQRIKMEKGISLTFCLQFDTNIVCSESLGVAERLEG